MNQDFIPRTCCPELTRRTFLTTTTVSLLGGAAKTNADESQSLIASIEKLTLRRGRDGSGPTWFYPRCCVVPNVAFRSAKGLAFAERKPTDDGPLVLMTLQTIAGSDFYGPVQWVTDGEMLPKRGYRGDLLLSRIRWVRPNVLV